MMGLVATLAVLAWAMPTMAAPLPQYTAIPTPTPGPDGRIIYIVQEGDTLWRISAITGVALDELRRLNGLAEEDVIKPGDQLLLGLGGPAEIQPTAGPAPTIPAGEPTPTPSEIGVGMLCVSVFVDTNGDALRQDEELDLDGSAINVGNRLGEISLTEAEDGGLVPRCYEDVTTGFYDIPGSRAECIAIVYCAMELQEGEYNISVGIPDGFNATTNLNHVIALAAGDETYLDFGAQPNSETIAEVPMIAAATEPEGKSPVLAIVGIGLLVFGVGLGIFALFLRKR